MKTLKTLQEEIVREFDRECTNSHPGDSGIGGNCPQEPIYEWACEPNDVKKWLDSKLTTLTTAIIEQAVEEIEDSKTKYPDFTTETAIEGQNAGDIEAASSRDGNHSAKDEDIAILRSLSNNK